MSLLTACLLSLLLSIPSLAQENNQNRSIRIAIGVDPMLLQPISGFVEPETADLRDSVNDIRRGLRFRRGLKLIEADDANADLIIHVVGRERRTSKDGGAVGITLPTRAGGFNTFLVPSTSSRSWVLLRLSAGAYSREIIGQSNSGTWSSAADDGVKQIREWIKLNRGTILQKSQP